MASPLSSLVRRAEQVLAELRAFNPDQERDERGRFAPGDGDEEPSVGGRAEAMHDEATIRATYEFTDDTTGLSVGVTGISQGAGGQTYVYMSINDRDGNPIGEATRTILRPDQRVVRHDGLGLEEGFQGQGFVTRWNAQVEESYRAHGIERIELNADIDVGGYAWARAGYDFRDHGARAATLVRVAEKVGRYDQSVRDEFNRIIRNPDFSPIEIAMIGHTPGATTWPGREMMLGTSWDAVKHLGTPSDQPQLPLPPPDWYATLVEQVTRQTEAPP